MDSRKRILIVEDEPHWCRILQETLEKSPQQYAVMTASTYEEAIEKLKKEQFALVTMDINLVGSRVAKAGLDLVDYLASFCQEAHIIVVSGSDMEIEEMRDLFKECRIHDFLAKKWFSRKKFMESVAEALGSSQDIVDSALPHSHDLALLHQRLEKHVDDEELRTLCFYLNIEYSSLSGEGKSAKAREMIAYLERRNEIPKLTNWLRKNRPDIEI